MASRKQAGDATGRESERLAKANAEELQRRQNEISLMTAVEKAQKDEVVDYTEDLRNQQLQTLAEQGVGKPDHALYGTTLQPGQSENVPTAGATPGASDQGVETAGAIDSAGYQVITSPSGRTEKIKTNSPMPSGGNGAETPGHVPGAADATAEVLRPIVDTFNPPVGAMQTQTQQYGLVSQTPVVAQMPKATIVATADLPMVTIGAGNHYDFEEGRTYKVPRNVADHLVEKGYAYIKS